MNALAIDSGDITKIGIGSTAGIVIIGLILFMVFTRLVARLILVVVVVVLGVFIWQQRASIENHVKNCQLDMSFFGYHIDAPQSVKDACQAHAPK
ncbi:MAG: hypothetical protein EPN43_08845 [Jatrophihabitans sp.]|nr:MAG: hypothetical protein EPN43_08845 [Jatrophihabitans sp.]